MVVALVLAAIVDLRDATCRNVALVDVNGSTTAGTKSRWVLCIRLVTTTMGKLCTQKLLVLLMLLLLISVRIVTSCTSSVNSVTVPMISIAMLNIYDDKNGGLQLRGGAACDGEGEGDDDTGEG